MLRFNTVLTVVTLLCGFILLVPIGETGEDKDVDGSLTAKVESKTSGSQLKSKARVSSGHEILSGTYEIYAEVDGSSKRARNSYSGSIYKTVSKSRTKKHNSTGRAEATINGVFFWEMFYVATAETTGP